MAFAKKRKNSALYRSGFEEKTIQLLEDNDLEFQYESLTLEYTIPATQHKYTPDIILPNGIIVECKGYMDADMRRLLLRVISQHPDLDIRLVFQQPNNKILKDSKTTYAKWAEKNGIKWGIKEDIIKWAKE